MIIPFRPSGNEIIGIEFGKTVLKIAVVKGSAHRKELAKLICLDIGSLADTDISKLVAQSFAEHKIKRQEVLSVLPASAVINKNIEVPSVDPQEIKEIINLQAGRHTPYSRNEIIVDYIDLGVYKHNYTKILLVITTRSTIKRQSEILHNAQLKLTKVLFAPEGLSKFICKAHRIDSESSPIGVVHIDSDSTDFSAVFKKKVLFIRAIPIGTQNLSGQEAQKYKLKFAEELKGTLEVYQNEDIDRSPDRLFITGCAEFIEGLGSVLNDTLRLPVNIMSSFKGAPISQQAHKESALLRQLSFLNLAAALLALEDTRIDLIPEETKLSRSLEERGKNLIKFGVLSLSCCVLLFLALASSVYFKSLYLKKLNAKYETLNVEARKLEDEFAQVNLIKKYLAGRGYSLEILSELYNITPLEMEFNDIRYDSQGRLILRGAAESMTVVFAFVDSMEKSVFFKDVKTRYTTKRKEGLRDVTDFEITCVLERKGGG